MIVGYFRVEIEWERWTQRESTPDGKNIWSAAPEDNSQRGAVIKIKQNRGGEVGVEMLFSWLKALERT